MANGHRHLPIPMGTYNQKPRNDQEFFPNSNLWYGQQSPTRHPETYQNPSEINRERHREFEQTPYGQYGVNTGQGCNIENPVLNGQQNFNESPSVSIPNINDVSAQTGETGNYKGTLSELDEFSNDGKVKEAVEVLSLLEKNGVVIDLPRYLKLVQACGDTKCLEEGRAVHDRISQAVGEVGIEANNKLLDMFCKCGSTDDALQLFDKMPQRNLTSWDTMITGLANNNLGEETIDLFLQFHEMGLKPDGDLFVAVFLACGVLGSVEEGMLHFDSMTAGFGIAPTMKHYVGIVDMLGRSGYLDEALEFIGKMPIEASVDVWETLMDLCRVNGYEDLSDRCAGIVDLLDPSRLTEESRKGLLTVKDSTDAKAETLKKSSLLRGKSRIHEYRAGEGIGILAPHKK
ncbi:pentatricopeptide repeat-containing protein, mitochondrial-like [Iris pallida]|uniref:Pentatricopeptide repeat-containing protein, mitochondrial-like n=1 Tax=Iris pallida TaxID=29817 RepID=A0AAX6DJ59_IRIPA|nr:pentatricopeptide repeat-containing protein, mitochondrial-like [Iris pallida]